MDIGSKVASSTFFEISNYSIDQVTPNNLLVFASFSPIVETLFILVILSYINCVRFLASRISSPAVYIEQLNRIQTIYVTHRTAIPAHLPCSLPILISFRRACTWLI